MAPAKITIPQTFSYMQAPKHDIVELMAMNFSTLLRKAMGDMTMSELSRESGVPISTVWRHLQKGDYNNPTLRTLEAYEAILPKLKALRRTTK